MFDGKMKAVTFSYDDGVTQDKRFVEILDRYGLKCTFNINSELLGKKGELIFDGDVHINHTKILSDEVKTVYKNHEVAVHTLTHPRLPSLDDAEIVRQVECDRENLSALCGYEVVGMAYPGGGVNNDERVADVIRKNCKVKYCRTIKSTLNFELQTNYFRFDPSVYHRENGYKTLFELGEKFISEKYDAPKIFYIWGHSYEFDLDDSWDTIEEFCKMISKRDDIFYGTNTQVLL